MTAGIDFAGTVERSESPAFAPGRAVVLTGWGGADILTGGVRGRVVVDVNA